MKRLLALFLLLIIACTFTSRAQDNFYDPATIQDIRVTFKQSNWKKTLDSLFLTYGDKARLVGDMLINGEKFDSVGVRYKGFSSWNQGEIKNPFNIDLNFIKPEQNYQGHYKLKLSNVIHDPSFVREVLSYEIARKYMPASRANYVRLYINDTLIGLYTNVEPVDKLFVLNHYGSSGNTFFKGEPDTLIYPFGQNANLALTHGDDSLGYKSYYNMESKYGWSDLYNFIRILNDSPESVENVLNTDRALWMHAFNYSVLNLDSYIGYSQNYYMYKDQLGRFNPILWDLNMSFGSFRESDGSYNFLGVTIPKLKILDPLAHSHFSITPRPLMSQLFANDTLKRMYLAHIRTIINENFVNNEYYQRASELQAEIDAVVQADSNKFYSYQDFRMNLDTTVGGTGVMLLYPGLKNLVDARESYLLAYPGISTSPEIKDISYDPAFPAAGNPVWIRAAINSASRVFLAYREGQKAVFTKIPMLDDGNSHDGNVGDGIYGAGMQLKDSTIQYFIYAENDTSGIFSPERAEYEFYSLQPQILPGDLVINEIGYHTLATAYIDDPERNSWIEILNRSNRTCSLKDCILREESQGVSWSFPDTLMGPGEYLLAWNGGSGGMNTGYFFPGTDGKFVLTNPGGLRLDSVQYSWLDPAKTLGRFPNGYGEFGYMEASPGIYNQAQTTPSTGFLLYPSPAEDRITLEFNTHAQDYSIEILAMSGQQYYQSEYPASVGTTAVVTVPIDISHFPAGIYLVKVVSSNGNFTRKLVIY